MSGELFDAGFANLPDYLGQHVLLSLSAMVLGLAISLPLAVAASRVPWLRGTSLAFASIVQTIPGLALLALFFPVLVVVSGFTTATFGFGFRALGFLPALLALTLYSILPVLRNTLTGLDGIDPAILRAARATGMTSWQSLTLVELPLAAPIIMAGVRTSAVWVIGTATLSTPVGQTSLGNYIFTGLQTENWVWFCSAALLRRCSQSSSIAFWHWPNPVWWNARGGVCGAHSAASPSWWPPVCFRLPDGRKRRSSSAPRVSTSNSFLEA